MTRRLTGYVHVRDGAGVDHGFGPDDTVPDWAAAQITNPGAWTGEESDPSEPGPDDPPPPAPDVVPPPMGGAGSGLPEWLAYAGSLGVDVPEESREKRDDVIEVLRTAGKPVERTPK